MANIARIIWNPLLITEEEVHEYLSAQPVGTAHTFERVLHVFAGVAGGKPKFVKMDLSDKPASFFTDAKSLNEIGTLLYSRMNYHALSLSEEAKYTVVTPTEPFVDIPFIPGKIAFFALSLQDQPTYYDLAVASKNRALCYNSQTSDKLPGLWHSGDMGAGNVLLHAVHMKAALQRDDPFVVLVSGYTDTHLYLYAQQNPAVLLVNHETKCLYLVPIPLDNATIGDATVCCSAVGQRICDNKIRFTFLPNPPTCADTHVNSGHICKPIQAAVTDAVQMARAVQVVDPGGTLAKESAEDVNDSTIMTTQKDMCEKEISTLAIIENGMSLPAEIQSTHTLTFGVGLEMSGNHHGSVPSGIVLPCCFGNVLEGGKLLALGKPAQGFPPTIGGVHERESFLTNLYRNSRLVVVIVSDKMTDQSRILNPHERVNGLFVLRPEQNYHLSILDKKDKREEFLVNLSVNAVTALAGPQSVVVVQLADNYFFYRGIRWPSFFENLPEFGADVTDEIHAIGSRSTGDDDVLHFPWPTRMNLSAADRASVYFLGDRVSVLEIADVFSKMSLDTIQERKPDIKDILTQLQTILSFEDVNRFATTLITTMKKRIFDAVTPARTPYTNFVMTDFARCSSEDLQRRTAEKNTLYSAYRSVERKATSACQWLIDGLGELVSNRTSSTQKHSLNEMQRRTVLANNVKDAKRMSIDDICSVLEEKCASVGVVTGNIDSEVFAKMCPEITSGTLLAAMNRPPLDTQCLSATATIRSSGEVGAILPLVAPMHKGPFATSGSGICWALPQSAPTTDYMRSAIPWPCFDQFVNLQDAAKAHWPQIALESTDVSKLRIITRSTIAAALKNVPASSPDIGFFMIVTLIHLMRDFTMNSKASEKNDFNDAKCQIMRGLFGQLFTIMASGTTPLCMAWQLVSCNPKLDIPKAEEAFIYASICDLIPHTAWPLDALKSNVRLLLVRAIRRVSIEPAVEPVRKAIGEMNKVALKTQLARRNEELKFLEIAVQVVKAIQSKVSSKQPVQEIARRVLETIPSHLDISDLGSRGGFSTVVKYFKVLAAVGRTSEEHHHHATKACSHIYAKRSGRWKKSKNMVHRKAKDAFSADNAGQTNLMDLIHGIVEDMATLSTEWGHSVKSQNWKSYQAILDDDAVSADTLGRVSSDAERERIPWTVGDSKVDEEEPDQRKGRVHETLNTILGHPSTQRAVETGLNAVSASPAITLRERLANLDRSKKAVELADRISHIRFEELHSLTNIPQASFQTFTRVAFEKDTQDSVLTKCRKVVELLLENWRSPSDAEVSAIEFLSR